MTRYTGIQIRDAAARAGFSTAPDNSGYSPADTIAAIALAESGGDDQATANTSREYSVGVYQINLKAHPDISEQDARDLATSSAYVYRLSSGGTNFQPWTMYKNGGYKNHLPLAGAGQPPASPVADPHDPFAPTNPGEYPVSGGTQGAGTILGLTPPSADELKQAGLLLAAAMTGILLVVVGITSWARGPVTTIAKAVA